MPTTRTKAQLAMTREDHQALGGDLPILRPYPGRTLEEVLSANCGLEHFISEQIRSSRESHLAALAGNGREVESMKNFLEEFLIPNITYLRSIGKLPKKFENLDLEKEFAFPTK